MKLARTFKKFFVLAAALNVLGSTFVVSAKEYPSPTSDFFVNDFANVISSSKKEEMQKLGENLYKATTAQVVVVTVENTAGENINDFCFSLAKEWGIGDKEKDNGLLILLSVEEREVRIEVGSGLEGALNDAKVGRILDIYGMEHFKENDFGTGLYEVYNSVVNEVYIEYDMEPSEDYTSVDEYEDNEFKTDIARIVIILLIVFLCIKLGGRRGPGSRGGFRGMPFFFFGGGNGGFSGRGGFSGGGFSGGGGGFSGGGSSRKF